jgi:hypothetical protein
MYEFIKSKLSRSKPSKETISENTMSKPNLDKSEIIALLKEASDQTLVKFRQELLAHTEELMENVLRKYDSKVARRSWNKAQQWCKWNEETGPVLMPDKVRLYYRRGNTEVVLQEIPPQIRHLKFEGSLALRDSTGDELDREDVHRVCSYSLALPYIHFIYRFKEGLLDKVMVSFCDQSLKSLKEKPYKPYFSNVSNDLKVCHGSSFSRESLIKDDISQQISYFLDLFWQTVFKDEWSQLFWDYKTWFRNRDDERMSSLANWQEASVEDPLFILDNVSWMEHTEQNYGVMLVRLFDHDSVDAAFQQDLFNDLVENFFKELTEEMTTNFKSFESEVKVNFDTLAVNFMTKIGAI